MKESDGAGFTETSFYFCNLRDCIDALDRVRGRFAYSEVHEFTDRISAGFELVLDEKTAESYSLFRLATCNPNIICLSDALARRISELHLTGMRFVEPHEWSFGM